MANRRPVQVFGEAMMPMRLMVRICFGSVFRRPPADDNEYTLSIEFTGSKFIFKCNDLAPIIYQVQTPVYDPYDGWAGFTSRVFADPFQCGYVKATFDDVYKYTHQGLVPL